jgi:hypothetical protein
MNVTKKFTPASDFLGRDEEASPLVAKAQTLNMLKAALAECLPANLAAHCSVANLRNGNLVVFAANNALAAKLKLVAASLPEKITRHTRGKAPQVTSVIVQVQPRPAAPQPPAKHLKLSPGASRVLGEFSSQLPDSELKNAIASLARRIREQG